MKTLVKNKKRIGFLSLYGFPRGQAYVTRCYSKMLVDEYDVYIMKQGSNPISKEFEMDVNIMEVPEYNVDPSVFKKWIEVNKLDAVVFNEYNQWSNDGNNLVQVAKDSGAKAYGYLVWEKWAGKEAYKDYDRLIAPTVSMERFFRTSKIRKFVYIPYSVDFEEFPDIERNKNEKFVFFHPGGYGGVHNRKNTQVVLDAFKLLERDDCELVITSQKKLDMPLDGRENVTIIDSEVSRDELVKLYEEADTVLLPSKWETVGLPILEAMASGTPVITSNAPPMNEFIVDSTNGYLVNCDMIKYPDIGIYACDVSAGALKNKMINALNEFTHPILVKNAKNIAKQLYDLEKNKKYFLDFIEKDLQ